MKKMAQRLSVLALTCLTGATLLFVTACGDDPPEPEQPTPELAVVVFETEEPTPSPTVTRFPTTTPCTPPGHELQAWNNTGNGTGQTYTPGNPLPETWVSDTSNTHTLYGTWRHRATG